MKNLLKKMSLVALLLVAAVVTVGCGGGKKDKFKVTYFDANGTQVGTEDVVEGNAPSGKVSGYYLNGVLYTDQAMQNPFSGKVEAAINLYGNFQKDGYTYNGSFSLSPSTFNPFQYKSTNDSVPLDYTTTGLYGFAYNADATGFEIVPVNAAADPVDVTKEYAVDNSWGIEGKEANYAFRIALNRDAKWENGTPITADDYIYSMQELLDPEMANYRASDYYSGSAAIFGTKDYFYSGQKTFMSAVEVLGDNIPSWEGQGLYFDANNINAFDYIFGVTDMTQLGGYQSYFTVNGVNVYEKLVGYTDPTPLTQEIYDYIKLLFSEGAPLSGFWGWADAEIGYFTVAEKAFEEYPWDKVGLIKKDDYTLDIIYTTELVGFYQKYTIGLPLVYKPLYEELKVQDSNGIWSSSYGTSVDTYMGYGPYKMTQYIVDQLMVFEKNYNWFGFQEAYKDTYGTFTREFDGATCEQYQTTKVVLRYVPEIATREQMFLAGQLDAFGMTKNEYDKYKSSIRLYSATGASTFYGILSSDYAALVEGEAIDNGVQYDPSYDGSVQKYNKTILTIKEFRQALTYALDRNKLVANLYPGGTPAKSLYSNLIVADPDNGIAFNSFDATKEAICAYWNVQYGEGQPYATLDEAYAAITGYDLAKAKELVNVAVEKAIEQKLMGPNTIVRLKYCASTDTDNEKKWYNTMKECFLELFKGTALEGKFEYVYDPTLGNDFGAVIQSGAADTAWGFGWQGGELDPYSLFQVYVDAAAGDEEPYQYDKWINRNTAEYNVKVTANLVEVGEGMEEEGEKEYEFTAYRWFLILNGMDEEYSATYMQVDNEVRAEILALCELKVLEDYTHVPMMCEGSVQLLSYKVNYGKESYLFGMGFGGIRYITYNYSDSAWADYVASQGGQLNYA